ncbi:unnamed protein product [Brugia pahangi]|uniref:Uncharacterized protein n=1 Tax=Brugia pahangi TaxID=6280 RepID=A0A0N4TGA9_BRUPA|nr:unnamed protein product [Brugia pahangi]
MVKLTAIKLSHQLSSNLNQYHMLIHCQRKEMNLNYSNMILK